MDQDESAAGAVLGVVAVHLQVGSTPPQVAADGGRRADPRGRVVVRVLVDGEDARAGARLTITGTAPALRELLTAMTAAVDQLDQPEAGSTEPPLITRPHDWPR